jgi:sugar transferase (PEP-CTERM/EpsH1 system associated)
VPVRIQGYHGWDVDDLYGRNPKRRLQRRLFHPGVSQFVAVSDDIRRWLEDEEGVRPGRVRQIYNGVDTQRFRPAAAGPLPASQAPLIIGSVGRLQAVKNHQLLVASVALLLQNQPHLRARLRLRIVGDGPLRDDLEAQIQQLALQDIVTITGFSDDVAAQLREMQLFVLPSRNEGISNTLLEAMAAGLPVVATAVGGNIELVAHEETGLLVAADSSADLAAALQKYCQDPGLLASHGAAGRERVEQHFSLAVMIKNYDQMYRQIVRSHVS